MPSTGLARMLQRMMAWAVLQASRDRPPIARHAERRDAVQELPAGRLKLPAAKGLEHAHDGCMAVARARHPHQQTLLTEERVGQRCPLFRARVGQRLAQHRAAMVVLAQRLGVVLEEAREMAALLRCAVLEEVLDHKVGVGVLGQGDGGGEELRHKLVQLVSSAVLQEALEDAAAVLVARHLHHLLRARRQELLDDKLQGLGPHGDDALLQDVVGMGALQGLKDVPPQLGGQGRPLLIVSRLLQRALDTAAPAGIPAEQPHVATDRRLLRRRRRWRGRLRSRARRQPTQGRLAHNGQGHWHRAQCAALCEALQQIPGDLHKLPRERQQLATAAGGRLQGQPEAGRNSPARCGLLPSQELLAIHCSGRGRARTVNEMA
mmetsp:Transcript_101527/g.327642  ORF Transcript_101527/g.327642 Transcript_101527/m.327642 type:complete len:377 (+) Transcript_101527:609-1739(+)